jgi:hypothetical protein
MAGLLYLYFLLQNFYKPLKNDEYVGKELPALQWQQDDYYRLLQASD